MFVCVCVCVCVCVRASLGLDFIVDMMSKEKIPAPKTYVTSWINPLNWLKLYQRFRPCSRPQVSCYRTNWFIRTITAVTWETLSINSGCIWAPSSDVMNLESATLQLVQLQFCALSAQDTVHLSSAAAWSEMLLWGQVSVGMTVSDFRLLPARVPFCPFPFPSQEQP